MRKIVNILPEFRWDKVKGNTVYLYRIASVSVDKVTLEKHLAKIDDSLEKKKVASISDETDVGTVTQKLSSDLIADISKRVDEVAVDFEMVEKTITSFDFKGIVIVYE